MVISPASSCLIISARSFAFATLIRLAMARRLSGLASIRAWISAGALAARTLL